MSDHRIRRQGRIAAVLDVKVEPPIHQGLALTHNLFLNSGHSDLSKNFRIILAFKISESTEPMPESIQGKARERPKMPGQQGESNLLYTSPPAVSRSNIHKTGHNHFQVPSSL